ncbi:response regulator transcription factor [Nonomuraea antimicrobica]
MTGIQVMLVDDQELLRASLRTVLSADERIEVTHDVANGSDAIEVVRRHRLDVVLMDIRMPRMDGVAATAEIVRIAPATRVLMLTTFDDDELVVAAIRAGASGYLTKDVRPAALAQAVCDVASGTSALAPGWPRRSSISYGRCRCGGRRPWTASPHARSRSSACSPAAGPTARSARNWC